MRVCYSEHASEVSSLKLELDRLKFDHESALAKLQHDVQSWQSNATALEADLTSARNAIRLETEQQRKHWDAMRVTIEVCVCSAVIISTGCLQSHELVVCRRLSILPLAVV